MTNHGEPCKHPGCKSHKTHPCEGCGRQWGDANEELCERVLPEKKDKDIPVWLRNEEASAYAIGYSTAKGLLLEALTQGILIPSEKRLFSSFRFE